MYIYKYIPANNFGRTIKNWECSTKYITMLV